MSFEETDTEESVTSLSELAVLDDDLDRMHLGNSLITSSKKKKDLLVMFDDAVLAATRRWENKNQEKSVQ